MTEMIFFLMLTVGLCVLFLPDLKDLKRWAVIYFKRWLSGFQNEEKGQIQRRERFQEELMEHIRLLLQTAFSMGTRKSVKVFLVLSLIIGMSVFLAGAGRLSLLLTIAAGGMGTLLPYLLLRCIVQGQQVTGSQEGEILVTELLNNYKMHYCNMVHAVEVTAMTIEGAPYSRKLLFNLSRGLNKAAGENSLKPLMDEFQLALGTSWAGILASNIYLACSTGMKVTESLSDLAVSMEQARKIEEFLHRENNEVRLILKYLVPGSCIMLTAGGIWFFGLSAREWFQYQFRTGTGIAWLLLTLTMYLSAVCMYLFFSVRKFDL